MKTVRRIDYLGPIHTDPERTDGVLAVKDPNTGFLHVDARLTRTGVFVYADKDGNVWGELRTEDEVFRPETLRSFGMAVLTNDHPDEFVNAQNVRDVQVGHVGSNVHRDGEYMAAPVVITDADAIADVEDGKAELSCGYTAGVIKDSGVAPDGTPYASRQTNILGNHVAIVSRGRAGPNCRLLVDSGDAFQTEETPQMKRKIKIGDTEYEVSAEVADAFEAQQRADAPPPTPPAPEPPAATPPAPEPTPAPVADAAGLSAMQAEIDSLKARISDDASASSTRIDARVQLVTAARDVLGADARTDGVADGDIMRQVVLHVRPSMKDRLDANSSPEYLRAAFERAVEDHREASASQHAVLDGIYNAQRVDVDAGSVDLRAAIGSHLDRLDGKVPAQQQEAN
jgi:hypothetical protein